MTNKNSAKNSSTSQELLNELIIDSITDIKGKNIVKLDLRKLEDAPTDYFIICEGESSTQVRSIAENIIKKVKETFQLPPSHREGFMSSNWVLVDFFDVVIHVFHPETRKYYELEDLWSDALVTNYENVI